MRWLFVVMPWHSAHYPSLGVGILNALSKEHDSQMPVDVLYANVKWIDFLIEKTEGRIGLAEYHLIGEDLIFKGAGEWVFSSALHQKEEWRTQSYKEVSHLSEEHFELAYEAHLLANEFILDLAESIVAKGYDHIGLTSTFMQTAACLALIKRIKELAPNTVTIMGGGNCDGSQGPALHRNFEFLDYVISGEGEIAFPAFLKFREGLISAEEVPGLSWQDNNGNTVSNTAASPSTMDLVPVPIYDDYYEQTLVSGIADKIEFNLVVESARGCWWGQKHHCTFCGLNGTGMEFRLKESDSFIEEIKYLVNKYQTLDIITADNIIGMEYLKTAIPALSELDYDLRIHYEAKANLRFDQLELLKDAGVCHLQPGIESLSTKILKEMDKGTTGVQNMRVLRDMSELGITATWNILSGFPEECFDDYKLTLEQFPSLSHIQPPTSIERIAIVRFSPYFNNPDYGYSDKHPAKFYQIVFDIPESELTDIAYLFDCKELGLTDDEMTSIRKPLMKWKEYYEAGSSLTFELKEDGIYIRDTRHNWPFKEYFITDEVEKFILVELRKPRSIKSIFSLIERTFLEINQSAINLKIRNLKKLGLLFEENELLLSLPTNHNAIQIRIYGDGQKISQELRSEVA